MPVSEEFADYPDRGPLQDRRWRVDVHGVPPQGLRRDLTATAEERAALAAALDLVRCDAFDAVCEVKSSGRQRFRVTTRLVARVTQTCVVSLEPLDVTISEHLVSEYWPASEIVPVDDANTIDPTTLDVPVPIVDGEIDLGQNCYELLATSLDPYPRKPGVDFDWQDPAEATRSGPFAELAKLKAGKSESGS